MDKAVSIVLLLLWVASTIILATIPEQSDFSLILFFGIVSFGTYGALYKFQSHIPFSYIIVAAVISRLAVIPFFPQLSDDVFRFLWDGRLIHGDFHPYAAIPSQIIGQVKGCGQDLFEKLNSPEYYSIYPPVAQSIFWLSTMIVSKTLLWEIIIMKSIHFLFELGCMVLVYKLLPLVKQAQKRWLLFAFNPLVIVETIANVHHEGIMLYFILLSLYLIYQKKSIWAGVTIGFAIGTKIIPILLCPFIFFYLKKKERWKFTLGVIVTFILLFTPVFVGSGLMENISDSAELYMNKFEFNGGLYYLLRGWGYVVYGFNIIHVLGPVLRVGTVIGILLIAYMFGEKTNFLQVPSYLLLTYLLFVLLSITIHPWYILLLIGLAPLTSFNFPFFWSGLILLTYINYSYPTYHENLWVVFFEYVIVLSLIIREVPQFIPELSIEKSSL